MALTILCTLLLASLASAEDYYCPPGTFVNGTDGIFPNCQDCPSGTVGPEKTLEGEREACKTCPSGSYCYDKGLQVPNGDCRFAFYCPQGSTTPVTLVCPPDFYCSEYGMSAPLACPASTKSAPGSSSCTSTTDICSPGEYNNGSLCTDCPRGTFQPSWLFMEYHNLTSCQPCPVGQYCDSPGLASPSGPCVSIPGHYCPMRSTSPTGHTCPKDYFCPANSTSPIYCPGGTSSSPGAAECLDVLITCPPGTYKNGSECGVCPIGTYQPSPMTVDGTCMTCDPGSYCMYARASSVTGACKAGYYCPGGSTMPHEKCCTKDHYCPPGSWTPLKCPDGTVSQVGETSVSGCIKEDVNCGPGTFTNSNGVCEDCPVGTYQPGWSNGKGLYICKYCDEGKYCESPGLAAPSGPCGLGYYCPFGSTKPTEELCLVNHYCPLGVRTPMPCPPGTTSKPGSTDVAECTDEMDCPGGFIPNGMLCAPCPARTYVNGGNECLPCPEHTYCAGIGNSAPTGSCSAGYFCPPGSNTSIANLCPQHAYCTGSDYPQGCPSGRSYPGSISTDDCSDSLPLECGEGYYNQLFEYGSRCYPCLPGYYKPGSDRVGVESCLPCPAGSFCRGRSVNPEGKCSAGFFCPRTSGNQKGIICPVDHYCPEGSGEPTPCPAGKQSPAGSSSC